MYNAPLDDMQFLIDDVCRAGERLTNCYRTKSLTHKLVSIHNRAQYIFL